MSRKNHKMVDGRLLQTDKKYSNLKIAPKEKINKWINEEICRYLDFHMGKYTNVSLEAAMGESIRYTVRYRKKSEA